MKQLSEERIRDMRSVRDTLVGSYGARDTLYTRYEEIYFMTRGEKPKGLKGVDENDIKETISSSGRDAVKGLKSILDSGEVHIDIQGEGGDVDTVEAGLKTILAESSQNRIASVDKDLNLSHVLYGPGVLTVNLVDDLIEAQKSEAAEEMEGDYAAAMYKNEFVARKLQMLKEKTPFLIDTVSPRQSYPMFGKWGMVGHVHKYKVKGAELTDMYGVNCDSNQEYEVTDFFYYTDRLVEAAGISDPLLAAEWVARDEKGEIIGSINIPVFTRYAGGSSLFNETDKQSQPLLYAKAKGNWDLRENLIYTYLFTAIYEQGLPGPLVLLKPTESTQNIDDIEVNYKRGIRTILADGQLADPQVIDGDVLQMIGILKDQASSQTVQPQTLGENTAGVTFSQFALAAKSGLITAIDPKEAKEALYQDAFTHILERIQAEHIENNVIPPTAIPKKFKVKVTFEPDLEQDDLRNAQVGQQLLASGGDVSKKWVNTNILKIADSDAMWAQKQRERIRDGMVEMVLQNPQIMQSYMQKMMKQKPVDGGKLTVGGGQTPTPPQPSQNGPAPFGEGVVPGGEQMPPSGMLPKTDAMIPPNERQ